MSSPWGAGAGERRKWEMGRGRAVDGIGQEAGGWRGWQWGGHSSESGCQHPCTCAEGQVGVSGTTWHHRLGLPWESRLQVQSRTSGQAGLCACLALPAATVIVTCAPMLCMLLGGEEVWPHRQASLQAGSPIGCLLPVVLVEAGLCSCFFASRGC